MELSPVRYAQAADGTAIAYRTVGEGAPTLYLSWLAPFEAEWAISEARSFYEHLAAGRQLIAVDLRGRGMSSGEVTPDADIAASDLREVVDQLGVRRFAAIATFNPAPVLAFAQSQPSRISRFVAFMPLTDFGQHQERSMSTGFQQFGLRDPAMYGRLQAEFSGLTESTSRELYAEAMERNAATIHYQRILDSWPRNAERIRELMPLFTPPLLAVHRENAMVAVEQSRILAAGVPNGRLKMLSGGGLAPYGDDWEEAAFVIEQFLDEEEGESRAFPASGLQTILFTDLEASTALTQRLGDEAAQEVVRSHNASVRTALGEHGGREVKHTGDGIMASFPSAVSAVSAALQIQRDLAGGEVRVRIGLNAGEPIAENDDLFGTAVQLAARITDRAEPGQVLVSDVVRQLCAGKTFQFTSVGAAPLKGVAEPVVLFEVR